MRARRWTEILAPGLAAALACLSACGGKAPPPAVASLPGRGPASPQAVAKMVQGVVASREPGGRDRALALLREAAALDPGLWEAHYDLGLLLAGGGDLAKAEEELTLAARGAPDAEDVALALGEVRRRRGEHRAAADGLGSFVATHPSSSVRGPYVAALRESGQGDRAIAEAREVLLRKPADADALAELALAHLTKGERDVAQLLAREAVAADGKSAAASRAAGLVALAGGDDAAAFQFFSRAAHADPGDGTSRLNVAVVLLRAGAYAKAEEQLRAVRKASPDDETAAVALAAALRGQGDAQHPARFDEARTLLEGVLSANPHHVSALFNLGVLLTDFLKRPEEGKAAFQRFLAEAAPGHPSRPEAERYLGSNR